MSDDFKQLITLGLLAFVMTAVLLVVGYRAGRLHGEAIMDKTIAEYQAQAAQELSSAKEQAAAKELAVNEKLKELELQGVKDREALEKHYRNLIAELNSNGMHDDKGNTANSAGMPAAAPAPAGAAAGSKCKSYGQVIPLKAALAVGKDCDALALRFNQLLKLYQAAQQAQ